MEFVAKFLNCQQVKYEYHKPSYLSYRMPISKWMQESITIDFVVGLPLTLGKINSIYVIMDRLMKSTHFVLGKVMYNVEKLAKIHLQETVRLHSVPIFILLNRGTQFNLHFWSFMQKNLGTQLKMSTIFHPKSDGLLEYYLGPTGYDLCLCDRFLQPLEPILAFGVAFMQHHFRPYIRERIELQWVVLLL